MKWFTRILLIYIIALLTLPCSDVNNCEQTLQNSNDVAHFHQQNKEDNCTPFCECVCCSIAVADYQFTQIRTIHPQQLISSKRIIIREYKFTSKYSGSIWQPPKFNV